MKELVQRRGKFLGERDRRRVEKALAGPSDSPREKLAGLYRRLRDSGLSPKFVKTKVLPEWWDDEYVDSPSILQQAITFISEGLGIDVDSLAGGSVPVVPTPRPCKLKTRRGVSEDDLRWSKCIAIRAATLACQAIPVPSKALPQSAFAVRNGVLMESQIDCVNLDNLLDFCWSRAIPILHLPQLPGKKMDALCGYVDQRPVIVLCNNRRHSAWLLFDLAHELGHIICGHIDTDAILVDERVEHDSDDEEEKQANAFAVELLTGNPNTLYRPTGPLLSAPHLAAAARQAAAQDKVDPGIVAMNYAWGQQFFAVGNAALNELEPNANAPELIRQKMRDYLEWDQLPEESAHFFRRITQAA